MNEKINIDTSLGEFVASYPKTRKVFEKFGLDYCCGGKQNIISAAIEKNVSLDDLSLALETAVNELKVNDDGKIWMNESLSNIVDHIVLKHHSFLRNELQYTDKLLEKVVIAHGPKHGTFLNSLKDTYNVFRNNLEQHLNDEETLLFPYIKQLETSVKKEGPYKDLTDFVEILNVLYKEHDEAGAALSKIRNMTSNYVLPDDACLSFESLYEHLEAIEDDLHEHIHLENTVLFPKVEKLQA